jgi:hypothetical protein
MGALVQGELLLIGDYDSCAAEALSEWLRRSGIQKTRFVPLPQGDIAALLPELYRARGLVIFAEARATPLTLRSALNGVELLTWILGHEAMQVCLLPAVLLTFLDITQLPDYCPPRLVLRLPCQSDALAGRFADLADERLVREALNYFRSRHLEALRSVLVCRLDHATGKIVPLQVSHGDLMERSRPLRLSIVEANSILELEALRNHVVQFSNAVQEAWYVLLSQKEEAHG